MFRKTMLISTTSKRQSLTGKVPCNVNIKRKTELEFIPGGVGINLIKEWYNL